MERRLDKQKPDQTKRVEVGPIFRERPANLDVDKKPKVELVDKRIEWFRENGNV